MNPSQPPRTRMTSPTVGLADRAENVATRYRNLVLAVGLQILLSWAARGLAGAAGSEAQGTVALIRLVALVGAVAASIYGAYAAYQLAVALGDGLPWLWAVFTLIPCVGIFIMLILSSKATAWCKEQGVKVGLLGPTPDSIAELRRRRR